MKSILLFFVSLTLWLHAADYPKVISLDGVWSYHIQHQPYGQNYTYRFKGGEPQMRLPTNWYKAGINHAGVVWFERQFNSQSLPKGKHYFLTFKGVDYICDVWLNGEYIGSHKGYFQPFSFEITKFLKKGENHLTVRVNSPLENYPENYSLHKTLLRGIFSHHDTRPGGAWSPEGQDRNSGGIWNSVLIEAYDDLRFNQLKITPNVTSNMPAITVNFSLQQLEKPHSTPFSIFGEMPTGLSTSQSVICDIVPANFEGKSYHFKRTIKGEGPHQLHFDLPDAQLWQTYDRGFPHLYTVRLTIGETSIERRIGLKSVTMDRNEIFLLNGQPLYLKGTNYISSQYMSEMDIEAFRHDLELMKAAHINTIRVHAHIEPERFYSLCDEMGFLVWQDYNLQWGYIESPAFVKETIKQAKEMVDFLYNHPSIFLWCMHNEPPWDSSWMKWKYPDYNPNQNRLLDDQLFNAVAHYDLYHLIKKVSSNLEHPWYGWYSGHYTDFAKPSKAPIITEFGAQALPDLSSLVRIVSADYLIPKSKKAKKVWSYHNFQFNWNEKNGIRFKKDIKTMIDDSQQYQARVIKFAAEMLRIQKYQGTTAIFQFFFNEGWPSMNWGVVDYWRHPKPGYFALQAAYAPIITVAKQVGHQIELYVVNDTTQPIQKAALQVTLSSSNSSPITKEFSINIPADSVIKVATLPLKESAKVELKLQKETTLLATNRYRFIVKKEAK
jgi:beta-mannosidase